MTAEVRNVQGKGFQDADLGRIAWTTMQVWTQVPFLDGALISASISSRSEYPIPWLEALFLPEFPNRSLLGEQHFLV